MSLPIRTTLDDIDAVCGYLVRKPTGATLAEAKTVVDKKRLDARKLVALKFWGLIEDNSGKLKLNEPGRQIVKDGGIYRHEVLENVVRNVKPYAAIVERAAHREEYTITATEVATHWHEHFGAEVANSDKILNDQAVCFFQVAEGADLGKLTIGRKGQPTRFDFDSTAARAFLDGAPPPKAVPEIELEEDSDEFTENEESEDLNGNGIDDPGTITPPKHDLPLKNRVFITHGKNKKIVENIKDIVAYGKFVPVVAQDHETAAKPVPEKVMDEMRSCQAAVIHVGLEGVLFDSDKKAHPQINDNVLIEIGAAMALYGKNFILLVEDGVELPSNLQGLYECRYSGDELSGAATMKLLKAFNEFV